MRYDDINLELIRCFTMVAECHSFTEAGERLHKSQSAVSIRIKKLEDILGRQLLQRTSRSVALSDHGERFLPYAMRLLHLNEEAIGALQAPDLSGRLRIGLVEYFAAQRLPGLIAELKRKFPAVELQFTLALSSELFRLLDNSEVDVIIAKDDGSRSGGIAVLEEQMHWVSAVQSEHHDYSSSDPLPLCLMPEPCVYRHFALQTLDGNMRSWREVVTSGSVLGLQQVILAGLGLGVMGASCVLPEMDVLSPQNGLPPLPKITLSLFGPHKEKSQLIDPIMSHLCHRIEGGGK
ncbi:MAG: LysR family transcriptional regulator [Agarilytica sp.]